MIMHYELLVLEKERRRKDSIQTKNLLLKKILR